MQENKDRIIGNHAGRCEAKIPGSGVKVTAMLSRYWDAQADTDASKSLPTEAVIRNLAMRHSGLVNEMKQLRK